MRGMLKMSKHDKFILMSMETILKDAVSASSGIGNGIETYPLCDYIIQSIFLKMTGYQEQKMKCIAWEIATNDFNYRRKLLNNEAKLGEYSTFEAKNKIYRAITINTASSEKNTDVLSLKYNLRFLTTILFTVQPPVHQAHSKKRHPCFHEPFQMHLMRFHLSVS